MGYGLGMVEIEAFDNFHFMHQTVRDCHTDHTDSIVSSMACIFGLIKNFICNRKIEKNRTLSDRVMAFHGENCIV